MTLSHICGQSSTQTQNNTVPIATNRFQRRRGKKRERRLQNTEQPNKIASINKVCQHYLKGIQWGPVYSLISFPEANSSSSQNSVFPQRNNCTNVSILTEQRSKFESLPGFEWSTRKGNRVQQAIVHTLKCRGLPTDNSTVLAMLWLSY